MKTLASVLCAVCAVVALGGCNTLYGIGKDIEKGGEAIQRSVK